MKENGRKVFVGLSGGVDSSVAALRLVREGYEVTGVFIKTWHPDFIPCNEEQERLDAMRVAAHLDIPFLTFDGVDAYKQGVAEYMIEEYRRGRTPNPDVMCNKMVKFGAFLEFALTHGADFVATGHYARVEHTDTGSVLKRGTDTDKDQSYFLWKLSDAELKRVLFPIGDTTKKQIRNEAKTAGLMTHRKADSQGICFLGDIDIKEFLSHYIETTPGEVLDESGAVVGTHDGAIYYTIGQRHGFTLTAHTGGDTQPHFVIGKDMEKNTITISPTAPSLTEGTIALGDINVIAPSWKTRTLVAQTRYRQEPFAVSVEREEDGRVMLTVHETTEQPSRGQSCVLYEGERCVGGGIIT